MLGRLSNAPPMCSGTRCLKVDLHLRDAIEDDDMKSEATASRDIGSFNIRKTARPERIMVFRRTLADLLTGASGRRQEPARGNETSDQPLTPSPDSGQFWQRDPASKSPWWFSPPHHHNGRVFFYFDNRNDIEYPEVRPVLDILAEKFDAQIQLHFSPYNSPFTVVIDGITIDLIQDNCPCPYFSVAEWDRPFMQYLIIRLKSELDTVDRGK